MSEDNSEIRDPKHINQIFRILRKEYSIIENRPEDNMRNLYHVYMIPVCFPDTTAYLLESFETILNGVISRESAPRDPPIADVIELVVDEGDIKSHSYIVAPIEEDEHKNKRISAPLYAFIRPATSGYGGDGPADRKKIQNMIDSKIPTIRQKVYNVDDIRDFARLFKESGPIVLFFIPSLNMPGRPFDPDKRFA